LLVYNGRKFVRKDREDMIIQDKFLGWNVGHTDKEWNEEVHDDGVPSSELQIVSDELHHKENSGLPNLSHLHNPNLIKV
jgi:hypothetical protein